MLFAVLNLPAQWSDITPKNVGEKLFAVYFTAPDTGYIVGWGSSRSVFMRTINGGNTWDIQSLVGIYLFNVTVVNNKEIYLSGYTSKGLCGMVTKSTDGGSSFNETDFDELINPFSFGIMNFLKK